jgi:hypothetical protein
MYSMYACMYLPDAQHVSDKHPTHGGADEMKKAKRRVSLSLFPRVLRFSARRARCKHSRTLSIINGWQCVYAYMCVGKGSQLPVSKNT